MAVSALGGERIKRSVDIGVGMVHLTSPGKDVAQLLHEAEGMATAARGMRSRAALLDELSGLPVPVENAELGASWHALRASRPHCSRSPQHSRNRRSVA